MSLVITFKLFITSNHGVKMEDVLTHSTEIEVIFKH